MSAAKEIKTKPNWIIFTCSECQKGTADPAYRMKNALHEYLVRGFIHCHHCRSLIHFDADEVLDRAAHAEHLARGTNTPPPPPPARNE